LPNGTWYWINYDIAKLDAGRYVETATFGVDLLDNLHKLMATMVVPMKWTWDELGNLGVEAKQKRIDRLREVRMR